MKGRYPLRFAAAGLAALAAAGQAARALPKLDIVNAAAPLIAGAAVIGLVVGWRSRMTALLFVAAALMSGERLTPEAQGHARPAAVGEPSLRILTFNAYHDLRDPRLAAATILASGADVVLVQEAARLMASERARLRVRYPYQSECPRGGCELAILSRWPMARPRYRFREADGRAFGTPLLVARVDWHGMSIQVATLHLSRTTLVPDRGAAARALLVETINRANDPDLVFGGDLNLPPWSFALQRLDVALTPMHRLTRALPTYPSMLLRWRMLPLLPIDHMYAGAGWHVGSVRVLDHSGSDHRPILVTLTREVRPPI